MHTLPPYSNFSAAIISSHGDVVVNSSQDKIIALLASPCNGPILSNPEHWACALPMTKDYFIDPSLFHLPSLCLSVSFLHFFMPSSNFLTVILCCFLPRGSHDPMLCKAGPLWVIRTRPVVDASLFLQHGFTRAAKDFCCCQVAAPLLQNLSTSSECTIQCRWWSRFKTKRLR